jgi:hypothetical protein
MFTAGCRWLTSVILATQETEIRRIEVRSQTRPYLEKPFTKIGLVEWLKVKALSSSPSTAKKKKRKKEKRHLQRGYILENVIAIV